MFRGAAPCAAGTQCYVAVSVANLIVNLQVRYDPNDGYFLLTAGFDNVSKLWSCRDYLLMQTMAGHEGKVMGADICPDGSGLIASVSYDRTVKFWSPDAYQRSNEPNEDVKMES